jgi:hypothetical protein
MYTQDELSSIWKKLTDGTECGEGSLEISRNVCARKRIDIDVEQTLQFSSVAPYGDYRNDSTDVLYTRIRRDTETSWGDWKEGRVE